jgi:predicted nucleotidyltransferase
MISPTQLSAPVGITIACPWHRHGQRKARTASHGLAPAIRGLGVRRLGLVGSFRHDRPTPDSDVDLYVELVPGEATFDHFVDLSFLCEDRCGRRIENAVESAASASPPRLRQR